MPKPEEPHFSRPEVGFFGFLENTSRPTLPSFFMEMMMKLLLSVSPKTIR